MCMKLQKPLNPEAEEWRPAPAAPPPPPLPLLPPPPLQLKLHYKCALSHLHFTHYTQPISFPPAHYQQKETDAAVPPVCGENSGSCKPAGDIDIENKVSQLIHKKGKKKFLPPRLRRASTSAPPPSPPLKLEWRPKNQPVAKSKVPADEGGAASPCKTTLMIKNIPNQLRRDFMLKFLDGFCKTHGVAYDFFYLPFDFRKLGNLGYAFVNFTTAAAAGKMMKILRNYKWRASYSDFGEFVCSNKVCEMRWARIQGKEALMRRFEKASFNCEDEEFLPVVLDPPRDGSDPDPPAPVNLGRICRRAH